MEGSRYQFFDHYVLDGDTDAALFVTSEAIALRGNYAVLTVLTHDLSLTTMTVTAYLQGSWDGKKWTNITSAAITSEGHTPVDVGTQTTYPLIRVAFLMGGVNAATDRFVGSAWVGMTEQ